MREIYPCEVFKIGIFLYYAHRIDTQGRKYGSVWGGDPPPQSHWPVGLKIRTTGLKIQNYAIEGLNALLSEDRHIISRPTAFITINYKK